MSNIIRLLPDHLANQIAAGEVVQRPASVVKELLENAVDAGATHIKLILKDAGKTLIQVVDDGLGMSETDARMAFERHATSKLRDIDDLFQLRTMGFRGEALASIAAVAQVELRTKQREQDLGVRLEIEASEVKTQEPCQTAAGTSMAVKNLFYNVPARRNFLKSDSSELKHIYDEFQHVALAYPELNFSLYHNDEKIFHLQAGNLKQRLVAVLGSKANKALLPIAEDTQVLRIHGFIGRPDMAKKTRGEQFFFVNRRFIKSHTLHHALMGAYEELMPKGLFPTYAVFFEIDPSRIDINVHPTKQEIKFEDERLVYNYLRVSARHALAQHSVTPSIDFETEPGFAQHLDAARFSGAEQEIKVSNFQQSEDERPIRSANPPSTWSRPKPTELQQNNLKHWEQLYEGLKHKAQPEQQSPIEELDLEQSPLPSQMSTPVEAGAGKLPYQLHQRYILSPTRSGMVFVDQEAAHQRILYERYLQVLSSQELRSQQLLFPQNIELSVPDSELLKELLPTLNALGLDIRSFGPRSFILHGHPPELETADPARLVETLLQQFKEQQDLRLPQHEALARCLARQAAVPAGKILSTTEMQQLIDELFACEAPHKALVAGKRTFVVWQLDDLQRLFKIGN